MQAKTEVGSKQSVSTTEIRSLTGIRGVAACYVMVYHYLQNPLSTSYLQRVVTHGYISVDLFFVLSGFVMALTYGGSFAKGFELGRYREFLWKRLGRIYPLYIVVTIAAAILARFGGQGWSTWDIITNALLMQTWGLAPSIAGTTWSISTEFAAYLLFPILTAAMLRARWSLTILWTVIALAALALAASRSPVQLHQGHTSNGPLAIFDYRSPFPLIICLAEFMLGLLAFRLARLPFFNRVHQWRYSADVLLALILILLVGRADVIIVVLFVPLVITLSTGRSLAARVLSTRTVHWLGLVSYSIYLMHRLTDDVVRRPALDAAIRWHVPHAYSVSAVVAVGATIALSAVTYHVIEKPGRDWARRLIGRPAPPIALEPSAP